MTIVKIAIAHQDPMKAHRLRLELSKIQSFQVVWLAYTSADTLKLCLEIAPDVILIDVSIFRQSSSKIIAKIMNQMTCLIVALATNRPHNQALIFEMMGQGAMDVINTNFLELDVEFKSGFQELLTKLITVTKLVKKNLDEEFLPVSSIVPAVQKVYPPLVVIGSSTGGPAALAEIMKQYPKEPNFATIIVQHVDEQFTTSLSEWLTQQTHLPVQVVKSGIKPVAGSIYLAGENKHLVMNSQMELVYSLKPREKIYRPSVDVFFQSLLEHWPKKGVGVLLTGMGVDGAVGLKALHDHGWFTIAEHRQSCIVYGMPKAAIELNAATEVIPLNEITPRILSYFEKT